MQPALYHVGQPVAVAVGHERPELHQDRLGRRPLALFQLHLHGQGGLGAELGVDLNLEVLEAQALVRLDLRAGHPGEDGGLDDAGQVAGADPDIVVAAQVG